MNQKTYRSASDALFEASGYHLPDERGHFGPYGGIFVSETLIHALDELKQAYARYKHDPAFLAEFRYELKHFVGLLRRSIMPRAGLTCWAVRKFI